jgi:hypothetical protein
LYASLNNIRVIKSRRMSLGAACSTHGRDEKCSFGSITAVDTETRLPATVLQNKLSLITCQYQNFFKWPLQILSKNMCHLMWPVTVSALAT